MNSEQPILDQKLFSSQNAERRESGSRARVQDRLMDRATRMYSRSEAFEGVLNVENLLLFIDDDLRETALSMQRIEKYLASTLNLLENEKVGRAEVYAHAADAEILDQVDLLSETLESLRRRMARLASNLR